MHRDNSKFNNHPRLTWFGTGGEVAYVDYTGPFDWAWFVGSGLNNTFKVVAPDGAEHGGFPTFDAAAEYALTHHR